MRIIYHDQVKVMLGIYSWLNTQPNRIIHPIKTEEKEPHDHIIVLVLSHIWLFVTPWAVACQASLFMEFSRQEYWSGLPFLTPGDLPDAGINAGVKTMSLGISCIARQIVYYCTTGKSDHINRYRKSFWKNSTSFMIKTLSKLGIEKNFINLINNSYKNPTVNIILVGEKLKVFPLRSEIRKGCSVSPQLFRITLEILASATRQEKKRHAGCKRRNRTVFFPANNRII